jgi:hypothetical protein
MTVRQLLLEQTVLDLRARGSRRSINCLDPSNVPQSNANVEEIAGGQHGEPYLVWIDIMMSHLQPTPYRISSGVGHQQTPYRISSGVGHQQTPYRISSCAGCHSPYRIWPEWPNDTNSAPYFGDTEPRKCRCWLVGASSSVGSRVARQGIRIMVRPSCKPSLTYSVVDFVRRRIMNRKGMQSPTSFIKGSTHWPQAPTTHKSSFRLYRSHQHDIFNRLRPHLHFGRG